MTEFLRQQRLRRDVEAYSGTPPTDREIALAAPTSGWADLADDTDWDALYGDSTSAS